MKKALFLIGVIYCASSFGQLSDEQVKEIESIEQSIKSATHDSVVINAWIAWDDIIWSVDPALDVVLNSKIQKLSEKNLETSLTKREEDFYTNKLAKALHNFGAIYYTRGDYIKAIDHFTKSLKYKEQMGDKKGIAASINNIGNIYLDQGEYSKAEDYYDRCLKISEELEDLFGVSTALSNLGLIYSHQDKNEKALDFQTRSLKIREVIGDKKGVAACLSNIGLIHSRQKEFELALEYYTKGLSAYTEIGDKQGILMSQNDFGLAYFGQGEYKKAIEHGLTSLKMSKARGATLQEKYAYKILFQSYAAVKNYEKAFEMHQLFVDTKDSLESQKSQKAMLRQELQYNYDRQAAADSIRNEEAKKVKEAEFKVKDAELVAEHAENSQHKQQEYFLYGLLALAVLFGAFIFNRFRVTSKQKDIIEDQKQTVDKAFDELEEKNTEILDSINYAKRIQNAILPPMEVVKEHLPNSFILYKPKDIVAGDFYWLEQKDDKLLFAAADCTGHGVPGAMVSVVCNNGLNRSVREYGLTDPGSILDKTREIVIGEFEKSEDDVKDGMDIALCSIEGNVLQYAGAHNPLWIIRDGKLIETKANKQPIGKFVNQVPYTTHTVQLEAGDTIYLFTDGYVDQFGGVNNRKFMVTAFRQLLLSIQDKSMEDQGKEIDRVFIEWKHKLEQIDDVCVIGIRV